MRQQTRVRYRSLSVTLLFFPSMQTRPWGSIAGGRGLVTKQGFITLGRSFQSWADTDFTLGTCSRPSVYFWEAPSGKIVECKYGILFPDDKESRRPICQLHIRSNPRIHLLWTCVSGQNAWPMGFKEREREKIFFLGYSLPCCWTKIIGHSAVSLSWAMPALCYFAASSFFSSYHQCGGMPQRKIKELLHPSSVASIHDSFKQFVHVPFAVQCQQEESRKSPQFPPDVTRLFQDGCSASMCQRCLRFVHSDGMRLFLTGEYAKAKTCWQKGHMDIFLTHSYHIRQ